MLKELHTLTGTAMIAMITTIVAVPISHAQSFPPRHLSFTTSHDFLAAADLSRGDVVAAPASDNIRPSIDRVRIDDSSIRLPRLTARVSDLANLVPPTARVDSSYP